MKNIFLILLFIFLVAGCTPGRSADDTSTQENTSVSEMKDDASTNSDNNEGESYEVNISMSNFKYSLSEIRVKVGQPIVINLTNDEGVHDLKVDELSVNSGIVSAGTTKTFEFIPEQPGTYEYYCSVGNHREMGMVGNLIVE